MPSHFGAPVVGNGTIARPTLQHSIKNNAVHVTSSVKLSASRKPAASHFPGSGPAPVVASTSATVITKTVTKSMSGPVPVPVPATAPPQTALRISFINSFLNDVSAQVGNLDAWTVNQYTKLAANRYWKFFGLTLLGIFIMLFLGPFYTHYRYSSADNSIDNFSSHLLNASLQTRNMSKKLLIIEEQVANLDAFMVTKEEFIAHQARRRQLNWLSRSLGANVILGLSSPAIPANITIKSSKWSHLWYGNSLPTGPGPGAALLPPKRDDLKPTYCVQKKKGRVKLQLAVSLRRYITPTDLIIEHWPKSEVGSFHKLISAATAPKEVELWVYNERARTKEKDINALQSEVEQHFRNHRVNEARVEKKLRLELHSPDDAGYADSWLMVGRWKYNIYSLHNVQKFLIPFNLEAYNFSTKSVVVRVNSNWGSSYATCLLRARLNGIDKTESKAEENELKMKADGYEDEVREDF